MGFSQIKKDYVEPLYQALIAYENGDFDEAEKAFNEIDIDNACVYYLLGEIANSKGQIDTAKEFYQKAVLLNCNVDFAEDFSSKDNIVKILFKFLAEKENPYKIASQEKALSLKPPLASAYINVSSAYLDLNDISNALRVCNEGLEMFPDELDLKLNKGSALLRLGTFEEAWELSESRIDIFEYHQLRFDKELKPKYDGSQNIHGKTVYVYHCAGFGDSIFFARYLPLLSQMGAKVIINPQEALVSLFKENDFNVEIIDTSDESLEFDYQIPFMRLGNAFKTSIETVPFAEGFLRANKDKALQYKKEYFNNNKFKVGIFWQGSKSDKRFLELENLLPLADIDGIQLYSLQKGNVVEKLDAVKDKADIIDLGSTFNDFSDTAAAIENLDLIIGCDTANCNIACALGKPTWLLLPYFSDWKWGLYEEKTVWYKSARLFRQKEPDEWNDVIKRVYKELNIKLGNAASNITTSSEKPILVDAEYSKDTKEDNSNNPEALFNMAVIHDQLGNLDLAINLLIKAIETKPTAEYYKVLGVIYAENNLKVEAVECFQSALSLDETDPELYYQIGLMFEQEGLIQEATQTFLNAINAEPNYINGYIKLGDIFKNNNMYNEAIDCYRKIIELNPANLEAYHDLGELFSATGELAAAEACFFKVLEAKPDYANAYLELGYIYLKQEKFNPGWELLEYRDAIRKPEFRIPKFPQPKWNGDSLEGKTIYVYRELGLGDQIQFARYLPVLHSMGAKVICKTNPELMQLFKQNDLKAEFVDTSFPDNMVHFDTYIPLLSIPYVLKSDRHNIPLAEGYLKADKNLAESYREKYMDNADYKIGLVWHCKNLYPKDFIRSIPDISYFNDIARIPGVKLYSLQKEDNDPDNLPQDIEIVNLGKTFRNFADTAAAVENLDLIISIDTSVVHLAGALGKPTYILLPHIADWKWFTDPTSTAWYNSARLFRQKNHHNWKEVIQDVYEEICNEVQARQSI